MTESRKRDQFQHRRLEARGRRGRPGGRDLRRQVPRLRLVVRRRIGTASAHRTSAGAWLGRSVGWEIASRGETVTTATHRKPVRHLRHDPRQRPFIVIWGSHQGMPTGLRALPRRRDPAA